MPKFLKFAMVFGVVLVGYSMWKFRSTNLREIVGYDTVKVRSDHGRAEIIGRRREIRRGHLRYFEVELPSKNWIDCRGDCRETLRRYARGLTQDGIDH